MASDGSRGQRGPNRSLDGWVLLASAIVVLGGAAAAQRAQTAAPAATEVSAVGLPPPLPSGAPMRAFEELPSDDERAAGCRFEERGFGDYGGWRKLPLGRALVPEGRAVAGDGTFRLLVHFHGAEPTRKQLAPERLDLVIAAVDAGTGSRAYDRALADEGSFERLVASVEAEVAAAHRIERATARAIVVSSWSAGYGAVTHVLARKSARVAAVVLLDSLYAGYAVGRTLQHGQLAPFVEAARGARANGPFFFLTHTAIATPGYASTAEVATFLLAELGATAAAIDGEGTGERFPLTRVLEDGRLTIRGYAGNDRDAHCAQLHLLPSVLRDVVLPHVD